VFETQPQRGTKMRKPGKFVGGLLVAFLLLVTASSVRADEFNFTYTGTFFLGATGTDSISGILTTTPLSGGQATVIAISGFDNGSAITGLLPPGAYGSNDNVLFFPAAPGFVDVLGISFAVGSQDFNLFQNLSLAYRDFGAPSSDAPDGVTLKSTGTLTVTPTPEPTSLALLGAGLLGLPMLRSIRRKND